MRESFVFIVGKPVDEPSYVTMLFLHDSLPRMACNMKYLIKMMAEKSGAKKKRRGVLYIISASAVEGRLLVHAGLATETEIISMGGPLFAFAFIDDFGENPRVT